MGVLSKAGGPGVDLASLPGLEKTNTFVNDSRVQNNQHTIK